MHTYHTASDGSGGYIYTVGSVEGDSATWVSIHDFTEEYEAALFASFLNGGQVPVSLLSSMWPEFNF